MLTIKAIVSICREEDLVTVITPLETRTSIKFTNSNNSLS
jgi:hypothetical protein